MRASFIATTALGLILSCGAARAEDEAMVTAAGAANLEGVTVTGARAQASAIAGLDLSLRETPQSITILGQDRIRDFGLTDINELLNQVPGVNVEKVETDRTYYNARGFDITNFQADGVNLPLIYGIQFGDLDTILFDRVEVVRGANALSSGAGNPSATINYVRKRPTKDFRANLGAEYGSWDDKRLEADVSGSLTADGALSGRLLYANEDRDSYLDHYGVNRNVYGGLLAFEATPNLTATLGYSRQDNRARGVLWGALPFTYSDGTRIDYPRSASTSADWTYWHVLDQSAFAELAFRFDNDWQLKVIGTHRRFTENAKLLYAYNYPDPETGLGVAGMSGLYPSKSRSWVLDAYASGPVRLFGRDHTLVFGGQLSRTRGLEWEDFNTDTLLYPAVGLWGSEQVAEPVYPGAILQTDEIDRQARFYAAAHISFTDALKGVAGFSAVKIKTKGYSYGTDASRDESKVSPYFGLVYDLTPHVSAYASYTDIFNPQSEEDYEGQKLAAAHGTSIEAGFKTQWFDDRLYATAAVFRGEQKSLAEYGGFSDVTNRDFYVPVDTKVTGYEIEAAGAITDRWKLNAGWTQLKVKGEGGQSIRFYIPRKSFKASTTYSFPELRNLTVGAAVRWQGDISVEDLVTIEQKAYAVADAMAAIDLTDHARVTLNVKNIFDKKYVASLQWNQSFYAAPRSVSVRLDYSF